MKWAKWLVVACFVGALAHAQVSHGPGRFSDVYLDNQQSLCLVTMDADGKLVEGCSTYIQLTGGLLISTKLVMSVASDNDCAGDQGSIWYDSTDLIWKACNANSGTPVGIEGLPGPTGETGPAGDVGPSGPSGEVGPAGDTGDTGPAGPDGPQGVQGIQGPIGPTGDDGGTGPTGALGPSGPVGPTGPSGIGTPGGSLTQVQFYDTSDVFGGDDGLLYDKAANDLALGGDLAVSGTSASTFAGTIQTQGLAVLGQSLGVIFQDGLDVWDEVTLGTYVGMDGIDEDDCAGRAGEFWYDSTDFAFEFCEVAIGTPTEIGAVGDTGPTGETGGTGPQGTAGVDGTNGVTGPTGPVGPGGAPAGSNTWVQFNDGSSFGGDAGLAYNKTTNNLTMKGATLTIGNTLESDQTLKFDRDLDDGSITLDDSEDAFQFSHPINVGSPIGMAGVDVDVCDTAGEYWWDDIDARFEFCQANSGTPINIGEGATGPAGAIGPTGETGATGPTGSTPTPGGTSGEIQFNDTSFDGVTGFVVHGGASGAWGVAGDVGFDGPSNAGDLVIIEDDSLGSRLHFYNHTSAYEWAASFYAQGTQSTNNKLITSLNSQWLITDADETHRPSGPLVSVRSGGSVEIIQFDYGISPTNTQQMIRVEGSTGGPVLYGPEGDTDYDRPFYFRSTSKNSSSFGAQTAAFQFDLTQATSPASDLAHFSYNDTTVMCMEKDGEMYHGTTCGTATKRYVYAESSPVVWTGAHTFTQAPTFPGGDVGIAEANYSQTFTSAPSVTLAHSLGTDNLIVVCYDGSDVQIEPDEVTIAGSTPWAVTVDFASNQAGRCVVNGSSGGSGSGTENYSQSFTAQTSVSLTHGLGTKDLIIACYDGSDVQIGPDDVTVAGSTPWAVAVEFSSSQTGRCVVNGSGGTASSSERYVASFTSQTTVTLASATHGLSGAPLAVTCFDDSTPRAMVEPDSYTYNDSTGEVVIDFFASETGKCVLQ